MFLAHFSFYAKVFSKLIIAIMVCFLKYFTKHLYKARAFSSIVK